MLFAVVFLSFLLSDRVLAQTNAGFSKVPTCPKGPLTGLNPKDSFLQNPSSERYPPIMVLVSFSMPLESLKALGQALKKVGGTLVFRGLYHNSFLKTAKKFQELGFEALIDPTLFRAFQVRQVPAFILTAPSVSHQEDLKGSLVYGHITLQGALEIFEKNKIKKASFLLKRLRKADK